MAGLFLALALTVPAFAAPRTLVIYDNDWNVAGGGYVAQSSIPVLLSSPAIDLIGLTAVSGDNWRDEGTASLLRYLEIIGATRIPVMKGAVLPLLNNPRRHAAWQSAHGAVPWSGALGGTAHHAGARPADPFPAEGTPRIAARDESAVAFMIRMVRAHPHQVVLYAEGPLTNIALAVRQDPDFAGLVKRIVINGTNAASDRDTGRGPPEFNVMFDPEAAHIVLSAGWRDIFVIGAASDSVPMTQALKAQIAAIHGPAARYAADHALVDAPLWAELGAAIVADPSIVTGSVAAIMDVDIDHGRTYGSVRTRPADEAGDSGAHPVRLVTAIDRRRFVDLWLASLDTSAGRSPPLLP